MLSLPLTNCGKPVADLERSPGGGGHPRGHADTLGLGSLDNLTVDIGMDGNGKSWRRARSTNNGRHMS